MESGFAASATLRVSASLRDPMKWRNVIDIVNHLGYMPQHLVGSVYSIRPVCRVGV